MSAIRNFRGGIALGSQVRFIGISLRRGCGIFRGGFCGLLVLDVVGSCRSITFLGIVWKRE